MTHGHLNSDYLMLITFFVFLLNIFYQKKGCFVLTEESFFKWMSFVWLLFSFSLSYDPEMIYAHDNPWNATLKVLLWLNLAVAILNFIGTNFKFNFPPELPIKIGAIILFFVFLLVIPSSPNPHIDVWVYARMGADYLLGGENPYLFKYPDLYSGEYELTRGYCYWPLPAYLFTLSRALFSDVRWILFAFQLLSAVALFRLAKSFGRKFKTRMIVALCWLSFPVGLFVLEQSWTDIITIPLLIFMAYFLDKKEWIKAGIMTGLACACKQYMVFVPIVTVCYVIKSSSIKTSLNYAVSTIVTISFCFAPFLLWDANALIGRSIVDILKLGYRDDALSWVAYLNRYHSIHISGAVSGLLYFLTLGYLCLWIFFKQTIKISDLLFSLITIYSVVFLFGKQAFCNYYYLLSSLIITFAVTIYLDKSSVEETGYIAK